MWGVDHMDDQVFWSKGWFHVVSCLPNTSSGWYVISS